MKRASVPDLVLLSVLSSPFYDVTPYGVDVDLAGVLDLELHANTIGIV